MERQRPLLLAYTLSQRYPDKRIAVVDTDVSGGQQWAFLRVNNPKTTGDILNIVSPEETHITREDLREIKHISEDLGCDFYFSPRDPNVASIIPVSFYKELISVLKTAYDFIIIDTGVNYTDHLIKDVIYPVSDKIIFVSNLVTSSLTGTAQWIQEVCLNGKEAYGVEPSQVGIVLNKFIDLGKVGISQDFLQSLTDGQEIVGIIPNNDLLFLSETNAGHIQGILHKNEGIKREFETIADFVIK